ncbi:MAG: hypothetical protein NWF05_06415 [Candidatus Bathyarchaeota archaeon]|nr:hypothetical protein [Candidatus Bathyarchaeota archaeon]
MSQVFKKQDVSRILSAVPPEKVFRFCTASGVYTNVTANSLEDFTNKLESVDASAILFHYPRGDFQAWINNVVGDNVLADRMCFIQRNIPGERLRQDLQKILNRRITELKTQS